MLQQLDESVCHKAEAVLGHIKHIPPQEMENSSVHIAFWYVESLKI